MSALRTDLALLNGGHSTRWGNLGCWTEATSYPDACSALARRLGDAARLGPGDRVLDCGVGAGEQLALWVRAFDVAQVVGLELLGENVRAARRAVRDAGLAERIRVEQGSATRLGKGPVSRCSVNPFDAVLALDCAYHFRPRARFFREAAELLRPGGRLAVTDIVLGSAAPPPLRSAARWAGIPPANLKTQAAYREELESAGWRITGWEVLDAGVLAGFARFALGPMRRAALRQPLSGWPKIVGTGLGCRLAYDRAWMHYVLISGERS